MKTPFTKLPYAKNTSQDKNKFPTYCPVYHSFVKAKVHAFIAAVGKRTGRHHEIYLSDIRKADPAKWKTVIRQPLR